MKTNLHGRRWGELLGSWNRAALRLAGLTILALAAGYFTDAQAQIGNDQCAGAIALTSGSPFSMNTANATSTGDPLPTCQATFGKGVWFKYTPTGNGLVTISTCGSSFDTVLQVYTGTCASLTPVVCNDDNGPACSGLQASANFLASAGTTYLILAGGFNSGSGTLVITASLANDQCSGAIALSACAPYTMSTADATSSGDPAPTCQSNFGKGVWFSYLLLSAGPVTFSTCGSSFDTVLQVFTGSCGNLVPVSGGCDDDNGPACAGVTASVTVTGAVNTIYYLLAGGFGGASGTLQMNVLDPNPVVTCPPNLVLSTDPGTCSKSNVTYSATATENCTNLPVSFNPPSGSTFAKGTNTVICTATDASGAKATCSFTVTVLDTQAPQLTCPSNLVFSTDLGSCSKSNVTYTATATDNCDPSVLLYFSPPSGSTFSKGTNLVQVFATDSSGNTTNCSFTVTVRDTQAPQITCPGNLQFVVDAATCSKSNVTYSASATDNCDPAVPIIFSPPSGSTFPKGTNTVQCTATDSSGNTGTCTFTVTVLDFITLTCQTDRVVAATSTVGAMVRYSVIASDNCDPTLSVTSSPPSGSVLPYGTTPVATIASTATGNRTVCGFNVTVVTPSCCQGKFWGQTDTSSPGNRYGHAMAYDGARGRVVLFGGNGNSGFLGDTWEWNGASWTLMATSGPSARVYMAMDYDSRIGRTILFGGLGVGGTFLGDTWTWDGISWQKVPTQVAPSPREAHAMAYDSARKRSVLFGGASGTTFLGDTWEFDGAQWFAMTPGPVVPAPRGAHAMAYGSAQAQLLLFGGATQGSALFGDTWKWDGVNWTLLASNGPSAREFPAMAYNDNCDAAVLFGGLQGTNYLSDTWEWNGNTWSLTGSNNPAGRAAHAMAHDSANAETVLFGGQSSQGIAGDTRLYGASQTPPVVLSTYAACGEQRIVVAFSAPMDPVSAQNINNYAISCGGVVTAITKAILTDDARIVWLYLSQPLNSNPLTGNCCSLTINGVRDACGHMLRQYGTTVCCTTEPCPRGSAGNEYWLTFPGNYAPDPTNPPAPQLFIAGAAGVLGTVSMPGYPAWVPVSFVIPAVGVSVVTLPAAADLANANDVIGTNGIHVVASQPVSVYGHNHIRYTTDSYLGLSTRAIGQSYLVLAYQNENTGVPELNGVQFAIAAAQDNTTVTIVPSVGVGVHAAGVPFAITMMHGQTYQLRDTNDYPADLTGTLITSDQPISVFGSHQCANIPNPNTFFCDYIVEQLPPTELWGNNFITAPLATRLSGDTFRIMAMLNGTSVSVNGGALGTLNQGKFFEIQLTSAAQITSTRPVLVAQYADSSDFDSVPNSDPFMVLVPPTPLYASSYIVETPTVDFSGNYINIMAPSAAVGQVKVDGVVVGGFSAVGASGYSVAQAPVGTGPHTLVNAGGQPFGVIVYGWNLYDAYGYPGGMCNSPQGQTNRFICPPTNTVVQAGAGCVAAVPDLRAQVGNGSAALVILQNPSPGTLVGPGNYNVTLTIVDQNGQRTICNPTLTVTPSSGPGLQCPPNIVTNCASTSGQIVTYQVSVCNSSSSVSTTPPSGSLFPPGTTTVSCVASNAAGVVERCNFTVTVTCVTISVVQNGPNLTLSWPGTGTLQKANAVTGPWVSLPNATSPYQISISGSQGFFRVKLTP
jgi:hypothetical protein